MLSLSFAIYSTRNSDDKRRNEMRNVMKIASHCSRHSIGLASNCEILVNYFQQRVLCANYGLGYVHGPCTCVASNDVIFFFLLIRGIMDLTNRLIDCEVAALACSLLHAV